MWIIQALEVLAEGRSTGKYRLTARSDEPASSPKGLCSHLHKDPSEAQKCAEARKNAKKYGLF
ncbi:hypothetical protein [Picosynechococcus sp. NKBG042902]|uniref:hypothetical protein n=1 Tax=Picosynechococcus sp. NKBG042902 TaxID=490193 RepID=UPI001269459F|nr:hypothetical protein [Picosynechococcus sp. NKBG042902]